MRGVETGDDAGFAAQLLGRCRRVTAIGFTARGLSGKWASHETFLPAVLANRFLLPDAGTRVRPLASYAEVLVMSATPLVHYYAGVSLVLPLSIFIWLAAARNGSSSWDHVGSRIGDVPTSDGRLSRTNRLWHSCRLWVCGY